MDIVAIRRSLLRGVGCILGSRRFVSLEDQTWLRYRKRRLSHSLFARLILLSKEGNGYSRDSEIAPTGCRVHSRFPAICFVGRPNLAAVQEENTIALAVRSLDPPW